MTEQIKMQFPAKREYIKAIRLALSGIASEIDYDLDEIEDIKTCAAEACILFLYGEGCEELDVAVDRDHKSLGIKVTGRGKTDVAAEVDEGEGFSEEISRLLIESLSDESVFEEEDGVLQSVFFKKEPV